MQLLGTNGWLNLGDAMCFLTDGAFGIEPLIVECCWDVLTKVDPRTLGMMEMTGMTFFPLVSHIDDGCSRYHVSRQMQIHQVC